MTGYRVILLKLTRLSSSRDVLFSKHLKTINLFSTTFPMRDLPQNFLPIFIKIQSAENSSLFHVIINLPKENLFNSSTLIKMKLSSDDLFSPLKKIRHLS